jgi:hypothetical protein
MTMPTWLIERGFRCRIVTADCVEPPHIHVRGHGGAAKLWLAPVRVAQVRGYNQHLLTQVARIVREHQDELLERWHEYCSRAE